MKGFSVAKLREKIEELEREGAELVKNHATPREIELNRHKLRVLRKWLEEAEGQK